MAENSGPCTVSSGHVYVFSMVVSSRFFSLFSLFFLFFFFFNEAMVFQLQFFVFVLTKYVLPYV